MQIHSKPTNITSHIIQLVVFKAGHEKFGIPIDAVREIIKIGPITPIPNTPKFIKGIINVRGEIVTTIDIKKRFSLTSTMNVEPKHIIVTKQDENLFGLVVDEVIEIFRVNQTEISPPPKLISDMHKDYVKGVITHNDELIIVLDLTHVLSHKELIKLTEFTKRQQAHKNEKANDKLKHKHASETKVLSKKNKHSQTQDDDI